MALKATIEKTDAGEFLVLRLPLQPPTPSKSSGKTLVVASSHGNKATEAVINGQNVVVGVNAYIYAVPR